MKYSILLFLFFAATVLSAQDHDVGDTVHAIHYNIHLEEIDISNKSIAGYTEIKLTPKQDNISHIPLELKDLTVSSVRVNGTASVFTHANDLLRIALDSPVNSTDTLDLRVDYSGEPFQENWGGFHFSGDYAFNLGVGFVSIPHNLGKTWFPCIDNFTDRATYDCYITVPDDKKAICGGLLVDTINNGNNTKTWHWKLDEPLPTYLISVAVGEYLLYSDIYYGIKDTIPITIYTRPSEINKVERSFVNLITVLE